MYMEEKQNKKRDGRKTKKNKNMGRGVNHLSGDKKKKKKTLKEA